MAEQSEPLPVFKSSLTGLAKKVWPKVNNRPKRSSAMPSERRMGSIGFCSPASQRDSPLRHGMKQRNFRKAGERRPYVWLLGMQLAISARESTDGLRNRLQELVQHQVKEPKLIKRMILDSHSTKQRKGSRDESIELASIHRKSLRNRRSTKANSRQATRTRLTRIRTRFDWGRGARGIHGKA